MQEISQKEVGKKVKKRDNIELNYHRERNKINSILMGNIILG